MCRTALQNARCWVELPYRTRGAGLSCPTERAVRHCSALQNARCCAALPYRTRGAALPCPTERAVLRCPAERAVLPYRMCCAALQQILNKLSCLSAALCHNIF